MKMTKDGRNIYAKLKLFPNEKSDKRWFRNGQWKVEEQIVINPGTYEVSAWKGQTKAGNKCMDINILDPYKKDDNDLPEPLRQAASDGWD